MLSLKINLLLLFWPIAILSFAQGTLTPFRIDNGQTGFIDRKGDTVFQSRFGHLEEIKLPVWMEAYSLGYKTAWILSENNRFGCLVDRGKWLVPCKYESLQYNGASGYFLAQLNGKYGTIGSTDSLRIPFAYDSIYPEIYDGSWQQTDRLFVVDGKFSGVYDVHGTLIVPPDYDSILHFEKTGWPGDARNNFYIVKQNGHSGLVAKGKVILEPVFSEIAVFERFQLLSPDALFLVTDTLKRYALFNQSGRQLHAFSEQPLTPVYTSRSVQSSNLLRFAERKNDAGNHQIISLTTGKSSGWYKQLTFVRDQIYFRDESTWGLLDSNFNVVHRDRNASDEMMCFDFENELTNDFPAQNEIEELWIYNEFLKKTFDLDNIPPVFGIETKVPLSKKLQKLTGGEHLKFYSLWNVETGSRSPAIYNSILRAGSRKEVFYWAELNENPYDYEEEYQYHVYNSAGVFLRSVCIGRYEKYALTDLVRDGAQTTDPVITWKTRGDKYGVCSLSGKVITPAVLDQKPMIVSMRNDSTGVYGFFRNNKIHFTDFNLVPLLNEREFETIRYDFWDAGAVHLLNGNNSTLVTREMEVLLDSCTVISQGGHIQTLRLEDPVYFSFLKEGYLYILYRGKLILLDSSVFLHPAARNQVDGKIYVDEYGKVIP